MKRKEDMELRCRTGCWRGPARPASSSPEALFIVAVVGNSGESECHDAMSNSAIAAATTCGDLLNHCHCQRCSIHRRAAGAGRTFTLPFNSPYDAQLTSGRKPDSSQLSKTTRNLNCTPSFEDFAECFPLYVEEDRNDASLTFNTISDYIEAQSFVSPSCIHATFLLVLTGSRREAGIG